MEVQTEGLDMMEDFIDEYVQGGSSESSLDNTSEEIITVQTVHDVQATPFLPDGTEAIIVSPDILEIDLAKRTYMQQTQDTRVLTRLQNDVNENRILMQELKTSINLLKATTSRIERDAREHTNSIGQINTDKTRLSNQLVDLEFQFHEQVAVQEETENQAAIVEKCEEGLKKDIENVVAMMEEKFNRFDERLKTIDERLDEPKPQVAPLAVPKDVNFDVLMKQVGACIARTDRNDKSVASAWVGLIVSLFLIPIAFLIGKFF